MRRERSTQGGTLNDPRRPDEPVRLVDAEPPTQAEATRDGRWLPGLETTTHGAETLCHGPMGLAVVEGERLREAVRTLREDAGPGPDTDAGALRALIDAGAWVEAAPSIGAAKAERWAAIGVSPRRAEQCLERHGRWRVEVGPEHSQGHDAFHGALEAELATLGFERTGATTSDAWTLLRIDRWNSATLARLARRRAGAAQLQPWVIVWGHWTGWIAITSNEAAASSAGPCPECAELTIKRGSWAEVMAACGEVESGEPWPGASIGREAALHADACARHVARTLAGGTPESWLRWWPSDENAGRAPEALERSGECPVCGPVPMRRRDRLETDDGADTAADLERTDERAGPWIGLYAWCEEVPFDTLSCSEWAFSWNTSKSARSRARGGRRELAGRRHNASGKGTSRTAARYGAIAEAIERDAIEWREGQACNRIASLAQLRREGTAHLRPETVMGFSERQYAMREAIHAMGYTYVNIPLPVTAADEDRPLRWVEGVDLLDEGRRTVLLPEGWVYLRAPADIDAPERERCDKCFTLGDSNGAGAGPSPAEAAGRAFCELVERDAFAIWWYARAVLAGVDPKGLDDPWLAETEDRYRAIGRDIHLLDATTWPGLPVVIAVSVLDEPLPSGQYDAVFTAGCAPSVRLAARRAVTEHMQLGPHRRYAERSFFDEHSHGGIEYAAMSRWSRSAEPWLARDPAAPLRTGADYPPERPCRGRALLERAREGARALEVSLIALDVSRAGRALPVVKATSPELCHYWHRLGKKRLYTTARTLGWSDAELSEDTLNPIPVTL